jgi:hypothetical protein
LIKRLRGSHDETPEIDSSFPGQIQDRPKRVRRGSGERVSKTGIQVTSG